MELSLRSTTEVVRRNVAAALDAALDAAEPMAKAHVHRIRENHAGITPAESLRRVEWEYRIAVTTAGGAAGAAALIPNPAAVAANIGEAGFFLTASAAMAVASAQAHGLVDLDPLQRRVIVTGILLGNGGSAAVGKAVPRMAPHWAKHLLTHVSRESLLQVNKVLGRNFVTKYGTKQGILVLGRDLPLGIGAMVGSGGNAAFAEATVRSARKAFGPVRETWDD
jgi:hypothetical protein